MTEQIPKTVPVVLHYLTEAELDVLDKTVELYALLEKLPVQHPSDTHEIGGHLHDIQCRILARPMCRTLNKDTASRWSSHRDGGC